MADELVISTTDLGLGAVDAWVTIETVDIDGARVTATTATQVMVETISVQTDATTGTVTVPLAPTAGLSPANVFYRATVRGFSRIFSKASGSENLVDTVEPVPPAPLGSPLLLGGLGDVDTAGATDTQALLFDGDTETWVPGDAGGAVDSVNGQTGVVVLDAADVTADPAGTAATAVSDHAAAVDPHGDRAFATSAVGDHSADTTTVHGIADTSALLVGRVPNLDGWYAALDAAHESPVDVFVIGDSLMVQGDIDPAVGEGRPIPWLISDALSATVQTDPPVGYIPAAQAMGPTCDEATGSASSQDFAYGSCIIDGSEYVRHTARCDRVAVVYRQNPGGGSFYVRDGGPAGTIIGTINSNGASAYSSIWYSDELTDAEHDIYITSVSSGSQIIAGIYFFLGNYDRGVRVWPACRSGTTSDGVGASATGFVQELLQNINPALVVYATGVNDSDYDTAMRSLIDATADDFDGDKALWIPYILPVSDRWVRADVDAARQIAVDYSMGVIDASTGVPDMSVVAADLLQDTTHPNRQGNGRVALHSTAVLSGNPLGVLARAADKGLVRGEDTLATWDAFTAVGGLTSGGDVVAPGSVLAGGVGLSNPFGWGVLWGSGAFLAAPLSSGQAAIRPEINQIRGGSSILPSGAFMDNVDRQSINVNNIAGLVSGRVYAVAVNLLAGDVLTSISWVSRTTALSGGTNQWGGLLETDGTVLAVSADGTSSAWGANTVKTFTMTTPYTVLTTGVYYFGLMVAASVVPTFSGVGFATGVLSGIAPFLVANSNATGLTTPPAVGAEIGAFTAVTSGLPYVYGS